MALFLSPTAQNLVRAATEQPSLIERVPGRRKGWVALEELARLAEPGAAPHLAHLAFLADTETARRAVEAIEASLAALRPAQLPAFDELARSFWRGYSDRQIEWLNLAPALVRNLAARFPGRAELIGLLASHFNGHVRQAAAEELRRVEFPRALPFLLLRANDWAEPVAELAREVLRDGLHASHSPGVSAQLARCFPLVVRLEEQQRWSHGELLGWIFEHLLADEGETLLNELPHLTLAQTRRAFTLLAPAGRPCPPALLARIRGHRDPLVRCQVVVLLGDAHSEETRSELTALALTDGAVRVRRLALEALATWGPEIVASLLPEVAWDRSASMRDFGRFLARRHGLELDAAAPYRELLASGTGSVTRREVALSRLGELLAKVELPLVARFIADPSPRVRGAALAVLAAIDRAVATPPVLAALFDPAARVRRVAHQLVVSLRLPIDWPSCQRRAAASTDPRLRASMLPLLSRASKWEALELLLANAGDPAHEVQAALSEELRSWLFTFNRRQTQPTEAQLARCRELLTQGAAQLPDPLARELGRVLG